MEKPSFGRSFLIAFSALVAAWLVVPTLIVIPISFTGESSFAFPPQSWSLDYYKNFFSDPRWLNSLFNSLLIALVAMTIATVLGTMAAYGLSIATFRGKPAAHQLFLGPLIMPSIVVAVATYLIFLQWHLVGTLLGFIVIHAILGIPFVVTNVTTALSSFDYNLERAAAILGASRFKTFMQVTLPIIRPGIVAGALFAFVISFDEVVVSLFIQSPMLQTLPVRMYASVAEEVDPTISAASTIVLAVSAPLLLLANTRTKRKTKKSEVSHA
ncbi:ABC transporter permease [Brevibacterium yomogidense]|uniref:ABC transporter permease n=1 Tax=Brevibacterium yomogidense TaxID=946573 RepID=UPI0018DF4761|nr:ABC transporter permease [Brevibacterium yomogidense]